MSSHCCTTQHLASRQHRSLRSATSRPCQASEHFYNVAIRLPRACRQSLVRTSHASASHSAQHASVHARRHVCVRAQAEEGLAAATLSPLQNGEQQLDTEEQWLADSIQTWQDDEWQPQDNHRDLGIAAAKAYRSIRATGETDVGTILMSVVNDLQSFNYTDTFTDAFEVANKVVELLMVNEEQEVCCQTDADRQRLEQLGTAKSRE